MPYLKLHFEELATPIFKELLDGSCLLFLGYGQELVMFQKPVLLTSSVVRLRDDLHLS